MLLEVARFYQVACLGSGQSLLAKCTNSSMRSSALKLGIFAIRGTSNIRGQVN
jgi:hypothetical protein